jgi:peroxiredoxin
MAGAAGGTPSRATRVGRPVIALLPAGSQAPGFTAAASDGQTYRLDDLLARSRILLVFYPGNDTPG